MDEKVFNRVEKKYLITALEKKALLRAVKKNMNKDKYYKTEIFNIYFDNDNIELINQSIDWTDFKAKLRARSYKGYNRVFIEIKTKIRSKDNNLGYKRRVMITKEDYKELIDQKSNLVKLAKKSIETKNDIQIAKEAEYLINHYKLSPKYLISYNRTSYRGEANLRVTFDENLKGRTEKFDFRNRKCDKIYFKDDHNIIMEIKAQGAMPLWLVKELSKLKIYPQRFSKIGKFYQSIRKEQNV